MPRALLGYLIAAALGAASLFVKEPSWLGTALLVLAIVIALLMTFGFARGSALVRDVFPMVKVGQAERPAVRPSDEGASAKAAPRSKVPRAAGPAGPFPVLQKQPSTEAGDKLSAKPGNDPAEPAKPS